METYHKGDKCNLSMVWKEWERAKSPSARLKRLPNLPQKREGGAAIGGPDLLSFINFGELYFQKLNFQITW